MGPKRRDYAAGRAGKRVSIAAIVNQAATAASAATGTASTPAVPTRSAAMMSEARMSLVIAVIPAAVPTASASVGDMSNAIAASIATATPRKIAGNTGPPRKPQPRQIAYASALAASRTITIRAESSATRLGIDAW